MDEAASETAWTKWTAHSLQRSRCAVCWRETRKSQLFCPKMQSQMVEMIPYQHILDYKTSGDLVLALPPRAASPVLSLSHLKLQTFQVLVLESFPSTLGRLQQ